MLGDGHTGGKPTSISRVHLPSVPTCPTTLSTTLMSPFVCPCARYINVSFCVPVCPRTLPATSMQRKVILRQFKGLRKCSKAWWTTVASLCCSVAATIWMVNSVSGQWSRVASQNLSECLPLPYSVLTDGACACFVWIASSTC